MAAKKKGDDGTTVVKAEANIKASGKATDLVGLGAAAKTKAAHVIAQAVATPLGNAIDTMATAMFGARAARVRADAQVLEAEAAAKAQIISAQAEVDLERLRLTSRRVLQEEMRATYYIESARDEAMQIADQRGDADARSLDEELTLAWVDGVKETHSEAVRKLYSEILANQTRVDAHTLSGPSLALLKNLDGNLASQFERIVAQFNIFGCYPFVPGMPTHEAVLVDPATVQILKEIGFVAYQSNDRYQFKEMQIRCNITQVARTHQYIVLSQRALSLTLALYGEDPLADRLAHFATQFDDISAYYIAVGCHLAEHTKEGVVVGFERGVDGALFELHFQFEDIGFASGAGFFRMGHERPYQKSKLTLDEIRLRAHECGAKISDIAWQTIDVFHERSVNFNVY